MYMFLYVLICFCERIFYAISLITDLITKLRWVFGDCKYRVYGITAIFGAGRFWKSVKHASNKLHA